MNTINQESILAGRIQLLLELNEIKGPVTKKFIMELANEAAKELVELKNKNP